MAARVRLDKLLVKRGLAADVAAAAELVLGGHVLVAGLPAHSAAMQVDVNVGLTVRDDDDGYVSRGAHKLIAGLDAFGIDVTGLHALDIGASTGGFTEVLLRRGATRVFAIDVGYGQLAWRLRQDPRVVVLERSNVRTLAPTLVPDGADLAVIDVSFISLTAVLAPIAGLMRRPGAPIVALVKPQFEAPREAIAPGGVVEDEPARLRTLAVVSSWAQAQGFGVGAHVTSPLKGPAGNVEYLLHLTTPRL